MRTVLSGGSDHPVVLLTTGIVYMQTSFWCGAASQPLHLSVMRPRSHFSYDDTLADYPCLVFLAGGSFREVDCNVWMPELLYYVRHGFVVASVEYGTTFKTRFPAQMEQISCAIRYIRANAKALHVKSDEIAIMGESAGGYFSVLSGLSGASERYGNGLYGQYPSGVRCAVGLYPVTNVRTLGFDPEKQEIPYDAFSYPVLAESVDPKVSKPILLVHGTGDSQVASSQSEELYVALQKAGVPSDLVLVEGAEHADHPFFRDSVKQTILEFIAAHI